jgi:hypothetical protein
MPNALRVLVSLARAVKRNSMDLSFEVGELARMKKRLEQEYGGDR